MKRALMMTAIALAACSSASAAGFGNEIDMKGIEARLVSFEIGSGDGTVGLGDEIRAVVEVENRGQETAPLDLAVGLDPFSVDGECEIPASGVTTCTLTKTAAAVVICETPADRLSQTVTSRGTIAYLIDRRKFDGFPDKEIRIDQTGC